MNTLTYFGGALIGSFCTLLILILYHYITIKNAAQHHPLLRINTPENAPNDPLFQAWAHANSYVFHKPIWRKQKNTWTSIEIQFFHHHMEIKEKICIMGQSYTFAINAPLFLGKPLRQHQIKQFNKLLKHWQIPEIELIH